MRRPAYREGMNWLLDERLGILPCFLHRLTDYGDINPFETYPVSQRDLLILLLSPVRYVLRHLAPLDLR